MYTVSVVPKAGGLRASDTVNMVSGNVYEITLCKRRWRWGFESEMSECIGDGERREFLRKENVVEWGVDCKLEFQAL